MAKGNVEFASGYCAHCAGRRKLERPSQVWGAGDLVMILMTATLWAFAKLAMRPKWRCTECGSVTAANAMPPKL